MPPSNAYRAQVFVDQIVRQMVAEGYSVEETHKRGYTAENILTDGYCFDDPDYEQMLGLCLVGGWTSKAALGHLITLLVKQLPNAQHRWNVERVPHTDELAICDGDHVKGGGCRFVTYVPKERLEQLEDELRVRGERS